MVQVNYLTTMMSLCLAFYLLNFFPFNYIFIFLLFHTLIHLGDSEHVFLILFQEITKIYKILKEHITLIVENPSSYINELQEKCKTQ